MAFVQMLANGLQCVIGDLFWGCHNRLNVNGAKGRAIPIRSVLLLQMVLQRPVEPSPRGNDHEGVHIKPIVRKHGPEAVFEALRVLASLERRLGLAAYACGVVSVDI